MGINQSNIYFNYSNPQLIFIKCQSHSECNVYCKGKSCHLTFLYCYHNSKCNIKCKNDVSNCLPNLYNFTSNNNQRELDEIIRNTMKRKEITQSSTQITNPSKVTVGKGPIYGLIAIIISIIFCCIYICFTADKCKRNGNKSLRDIDIDYFDEFTPLL